MKVDHKKPPSDGCG